MRVPVVNVPLRCAAPARSERSMSPLRHMTPRSVQSTSVDPIAPRHQELARGALVQIGEKSFIVLEELGSGSFGTVWKAQSHNGGAIDGIAIKDIHCRSQLDLDLALHEAENLKKLARKADSGSTCVRAVPQLVGVERQLIAASKWHVRMAMTHISGKPIDRELEGDLASTPRADRCKLACAMLEQLADVMEYVTSCDLLHRDLHSRNILLHKQDGGPVFNVVDFGLAVNATEWQRGAWQRRNVAGDCRYWPVSAWCMFIYGKDSLRDRTDMRFEYESKLDFHSLGLSVLQLLFQNTQRYKTCVGSASDSAWNALHTTFFLYWEEVTRLWQDVFHAFRHTGDGGMDAVRKDFMQRRVEASLSDHFVAMRAAVSAVRDAYLESPDVNLPMLPRLMKTLLMMIASGSSDVSWLAVRTRILDGCSPLQDKQKSQQSSLASEHHQDHLTYGKMDHSEAVANPSPASDLPTFGVKDAVEHSSASRRETLRNLSAALDTMSSEWRNFGAAADASKPASAHRSRSDSRPQRVEESRNDFKSVLADLEGRCAEERASLAALDEMSQRLAASPLPEHMQRRGKVVCISSGSTASPASPAPFSPASFMSTPLSRGRQSEAQTPFSCRVTSSRLFFEFEG